ncbi:hypothetical protein [Crassaminicella profunda]|uniref:hypothetical protein n=1 Tax=Crassaminicella profunda TaxID=1286698 RepID=UPI001CA784C5|nr:hypothetical protein [Crassaminicella profunda]QZY55398.1 hypothetical protein K7H06_20780 [Crassaminicella profunda]
MTNTYEYHCSRDSLLFFFLAIILILKDTPYCHTHPTTFLFFFLNLVAVFGVFYQ